MSQALPVKPNLEHLKEQAKDLLRRWRQDDPSANSKLADAQHALARDYGFASWPKLKAHVEFLALDPAGMLSAAVCASDADKTARVLEGHPELKAHINEPMANYGSSGMQALLAAVQRSDRKTIEVLLRAGADINARSRWAAGGIGVLDECALDLAVFLMERGAVLDAHSAARLGMFDKLREFVTADPSVTSARGANGQTVLHFASTVEIAQYLLEHGANIDARDIQHESTPAQHMLRVVQARHFPRDRADIARHLVARGCRTDILMAAALGDLPLVRRHVEDDPAAIRTRVPESGAAIYIQSLGPKRTPHLVARDFGHEDVFQFLMEHSPQDVKLAQAYELGDESIFRAMLASRPGTLSDDDRRQLPDAAQNNNAAAVRLMLAAGWPVDARGEYQMTSLQWASWHGNAEMVREILKYHPKVDLSCEHEITALGSALHGSENSWHRQTGDYAATVEALLDAGAKAPKLTDDLEASEAVREVLRQREECGPN